MTEQELNRLFLMLRRPIPFDPAPFWLKLSKDQIDRFNQVQTSMNLKIAELEQQKMVELDKIAGGALLK